MYVYVTSTNRTVQGYNMTKKDVETLVVEQFGVHHKAHEPSPTLGRQWNSLFQRTADKLPSSFWLGGSPGFPWFSLDFQATKFTYHRCIKPSYDRYGKKLVKSFSCRLPKCCGVVSGYGPHTRRVYIWRYCSRVYGFNFLWSRGRQDSDSGLGFSFTTTREYYCFLRHPFASCLWNLQWVLLNGFDIS